MLNKYSKRRRKEEGNSRKEVRRERKQGWREEERKEGKRKGLGNALGGIDTL